MPGKLMPVGFGDHGLMTVKGRRLPEQAEAVIYAGSPMHDGMLASTKPGRIAQYGKLSLDEFMSTKSPQA